MATQLANHRVSRRRAVSVETCPYCGQPLLDHDAVHRMEESERQAEHRLETAAKARAAELAKALTAQQTRKVEQLQQSLATVRLEHREEVSKLRISVRAEAKTAAERAAQAKVRSELREKSRALDKLNEMVAVQERQIENLNSDERGEMNEENLLRELRSAFPDDHIDRQGRGKAGGDILHEVRTRTEDGPSKAGVIVYECKDTLKWSNLFLEQARTEGVTHQTPYLVIVTQAFPSGEKTLFVRDGVVVVHPKRAIELAHIMRRLVEEVHRASVTSDGKAVKDAALYEYLASADFRRAFDTLTQDSDKLGALLGKERKWHEQNWAKRQAIQNELISKTTAIDAHIRTIIEKHAVGGS